MQILEPIVTSCQELNVTLTSLTLEPMVTIDEKQAFSARFNKVLDRMEVPPKGKGRQNAVAATFNVSQKGARKWLEGEAIPGSGRKKQFIDAYKSQGVTAEWLFYGNPDYAPIWARQEGVNQPNLNYTNILNEPEIKGSVPLISFAQVGTWGEAEFNLCPTDEVRMIKTRVPVMKDTFAMQVSGDSMESEFVDGDIIIIEPSLIYLHEDYVIARKGNDVFFRQIVKEGSDWLLKPLNKRYDITKLGEYQIIGVIREKTKIYR